MVLRKGIIITGIVFGNGHVDNVLRDRDKGDGPVSSMVTVKLCTR